MENNPGRKALRKLLLGRYTEEETPLGTALQILAGLAGDVFKSGNAAEDADDWLEPAGKEAIESAENYSSLAEKARNIDVSTSVHQAVFYSGEGNRTQAEPFARLNGKTTLEMTSGGRYFDELNLFGKNSPVTKAQAREIWSILSERYAKSASGNAYGFVKGSDSGSVFNTVEYKALQRNPYITNIFTELFN